MTLVHRQTLKKKTRGLYLHLPVPTCHVHPSHQSPSSFPPITSTPPPPSPSITSSSLSNCHMSTPLLPPHPSRHPSSPTVTCQPPFLPPHPSRPSPTVTCQPPFFLPTHHVILPFQLSHVNPLFFLPTHHIILPLQLSPLLPPHPLPLQLSRQPHQSRHPPSLTVTCQSPFFLPTNHAILPLQLSHVNPSSSSPPITPSSLSNCHMSTPPSSSPPILSPPPLQLSPIIPSFTPPVNVTQPSKCLLQTPHNTTQGTTATATGSVSRPTSPPPSTEPLSGTVACSPETWTQLETGSLPPVLSETHPHTVKAACQGL